MQGFLSRSTPETSKGTLRRHPRTTESRLPISKLGRGSFLARTGREDRSFAAVQGEYTARIFCIASLGRRVGKAGKSSVATRNTWREIVTPKEGILAENPKEGQSRRSSLRSRRPHLFTLCSINSSILHVTCQSCRSALTHKGQSTTISSCHHATRVGDVRFHCVRWIRLHSSRQADLDLSSVVRSATPALSPFHRLHPSFHEHLLRQHKLAFDPSVKHRLVLTGSNHHCQQLHHVMELERAARG